MTPLKVNGVNRVMSANASIQIGSGYAMCGLALTNVLRFIKSTQAETNHVPDRY
jgi:hypothetical protein